VQGKAEPVPAVIINNEQVFSIARREISGIYVAAAQVRVKPNHDCGAKP
jgi:hypothetical protein